MSSILDNFCSFSHIVADIQLISFDLGAPNTAFDVRKRPSFDKCLQKRDRAVRRVQNGCGRKVGEVEIPQMGPPWFYPYLQTV